MYVLEKEIFIKSNKMDKEVAFSKRLVAKLVQFFTHHGSLLLCCASHYYRLQCEYLP